jgi:flagellar M-ring protein FliF
MADMDTTLNTAGAAVNATGFAAIPLKKKLALGLGVAGLAAVIAVSAMWSRTPDYRVLFANLNDRDGGAVIAALSQMNVPYQYAAGGGAILVPETMVHDARLRLASQGLPKGGTVGFELMENQKFGVTQFQERLNFQRGLEGELARSIQSLEAVQGARVHLALPAQSGFLRDQQKPSASVLLQLHPGRTLDRSQIAGIVHLVASSIPDLAPRQVSIVDQNGSLLSSQEGNATAGMDATQLGYVRHLESAYIQRIVDILEPIVGRGNVRAQVSADIDFTQTESTAEEYRPNQGANANAAIRSQQVLEGGGKDGSSTTTTTGVPGALSNQPSPTPTANVNGPAQQLSTSANASGQPATGAARREAVTNFEVDKTVKVTRNAPGQVRRLTAAVVLNHRKVEEKGKMVQQPLSEKELDSVTALVREAIGMNKERGDSVNVMNAAFTPEEVPKQEEIPLWKQPETLSMAKDAGKHLGLLLLGLITIFAVIRPALKSVFAAAPAARLNARVSNDVALPAPDGAAALPAPTGLSPAEALRIARENPVAAANVVRTWVGTGNG